VTRSSWPTRISRGAVSTRADGINVDVLLRGIIPLFELDSYAPPLVMMAPVAGDELEASVEQRYRQALFGAAGGPTIARIDRFAFYDRAKAAFAVVMTGELAKYGNILLKKGVTPPFVG
jgi:L-fucose mutarotase